MKKRNKICRKEKMEQVRAFDCTYTKLEEDNIMLQKMAAYFMEVMSVMIFFLCCLDEFALGYNFLLLYFMSIKLHMDKYMIVKEEGCKARSIYEVLRMVPVNPYEIYQVRKEYARNLLKKRVVVLYVVDFIAILFMRTIHWGNFVFPIASVVLVWCLLLLTMRPSRSEKK